MRVYKESKVVTSQAAVIGRAAALPADAGKRFDLLVVAATLWFGFGLFSDGWAHVNGLPDSFWTVWHAILYSGYAATAAVILGAVALRRPAAAGWRAAIPRGYEVSLVGVLVFGIGGLADMAWHLAFGVEVGNDALLSPSHLLLALGGALMATGPLRADLSRGDRSRSLAGRLPMVLSLTLFFSVLTFFTLYADPYAPLLSARFSGLGEDKVFHGLLTMFLFSALLSGALLAMLRRTVLPAGALTVLLGINAVAMNLMHSRGPAEITLTFIGIALLTGVIGDVLIAVLRPSAARPIALRLIAALVPTVFWTLYFPGVAIHRGPLAWSFTFISGAIVLCAVVGLLLSFVAIPPAESS
jgi:hypothetical protein